MAPGQPPTPEDPELTLRRLRTEVEHWKQVAEQRGTELEALRSKNLQLLERLMAASPPPQ